MTDLCPLCGSDSSELYHRDRQRSYYRCPTCSLVFVPAGERLDREQEYAEYLHHENAVDDPGYRRFLRRLVGPLVERLPPGATGLDFGCGPAPALAAMLEESGHTVSLHDSFFCPDPEALMCSYDFITATEVVEHLHAPGTILDQLWSCLHDGAYLGLMTKLVRDRESFATWHYIRDPTHVCFFSQDTFRWWAAHHTAELEFAGSDVILMRKLPRSS